MNFGPYRDLQKLGEGASGAAYKAQDSRDGRIVAIKTISGFEPDGFLTARSVLLRGAEQLALLHHRCIPAVYEVIHQDSSLYIVTEFVVGESLDRLTKAGQKLRLSRRLEIIKNACAVMHDVHEHGIVHRAMKPSKILVLQDNSVKILGFGISTIWLFLSAELPHLPYDVHYHHQGTFRGDAIFGPGPDIWSIGVILFELLQGRLPFVGTNLEDLYGQILKAEIPATPIELPLAGEFDKILARALAKQAEYQYRSIGELAADLGTLIPEVRQCEEDNDPTSS